MLADSKLLLDVVEMVLVLVLVDVVVFHSGSLPFQSSAVDLLPPAKCLLNKR